MTSAIAVPVAAALLLCAPVCGAVLYYLFGRTGLPMGKNGYQDFAGSFEGAIMVVSMDLKKIYYASPGFQRVFGSNPKSSAFNELAALVHEDDLENLLEKLRSGRDHFFEMEFRIHRENGTPWILAKGYPVPGIGGKRLALWAQDISRRKRDELTIVQARDYEVTIGARIQQALLLGSPERDYASFQIASLTLPSNKIDGDFIDFFDYGDEMLDLIIGDVMGKGIAAALTGAAARNAFVLARMKLAEKLGNTGFTVQDVVAATERRIGRRMMELGTFATLVYGRLDGKTGLFRYVDCGHTSVIHYEGRSGQCWRMKGSNTPLGFMAEQAYLEYAVPIEEGDLLFLFSDGISEAVNSEGELFGEQRLIKLIRSSASLDASALLEKIKQITFSYAAGDFKDDVTGISVRILKTDRAVEYKAREFPQASSSLRDIRAFFEGCLMDFLPAPGLDQSRDSVLIAIGEAASNIFKHNASEDGGICFAACRKSAGWISFYLYYRGVDYTWQDPAAPIIESFQTSGYGLYLMNTVMDSVIVSEGDENMFRLCMILELPHGEKP